MARLAPLLLAAALGAVRVSADAAPGLDPAKALTQYGLDVWTIDEGLPQNTVTSLAQTPDGFVWVGTYNGLARFDGVRFHTFDRREHQPLGAGGITGLAADPAGRLFVGPQRGGLATVEGGRSSATVDDPELARRTVRSLLVDAGGTWVGTNAGLLRLEGASTRVVPGSEDLVINALAPDGAGGLYVGTHGLGLWRLAADGRWTTWRAGDGPGSDLVACLARDQGGALWIGTVGAGLARLKGGTFERWTPADGMFASVWALLVSRGGTLWVGGIGGMARRREADGGFEVLGRGPSRADQEVIALLEDREGSVWAGTSGDGLLRLRDGRFTTWTVDEGMSEDRVYGVAEDAAGTLWAGTRSGLDELRDGRWSRHTPQTGFCGGLVRSVAHADGTTWAGLYGGGLCERTAEGWRRHTVKDGLVHDNVRAVVAAKGGGIWVGTLAGLARLERGRWTRWRREDGLAHESILALLEARDGTLWIGTESGGVLRMREGRFEAITTREGLASDIVLSLMEDTEGRVWAGTTAGLTRLHPRPFATFTVRDGLPTESVLQMIDDGHGHLWLGSDRGVARISWKALLARAGAGGAGEVRVFDRMDGLETSQCTAPVTPAGFRTRDGRLWFSTARGLASIDPRRGAEEHERPHAVIEELVADGVAHDPRTPIVLGPGTARIQVAYTGLGLLGAARLRFRYRLDGYDADWVDAGARREAAYTSLQPGRYEFRVTACDGDGRCGEAAAPVAFELRPRFRQTPWFYAILASGAGLLLTAAHLARTARLRARERELSRLVDERTRGVVAEKERAETAHREADRQRERAENADALKTQLLAIAAHDLRNPLHAVVGSAALLRSGVADDEKDELAGAIHAGGQRMLRLVEDLLTGAALEMGGLELRREPVDLTSVARQVVEESQPRAEAKAQSLRLVADGAVATLGDGDRLHEILDNLVSNAIKFSPRGAPIAVEVAPVDGMARLTVRDQGPGLDPGDLARLFGPFVRLKARPTAGEPSSGLGLSIVRQLVELHGGRVWAESAGPGRGTAFVVELRLAKPAVEPPY